MEYMYHVSTFIPTKGSFQSKPLAFSKVRADGLHRAAARGDAEVAHDAASLALFQKIMVWMKNGGISNNSYSYTFQILRHFPLKLWWWEKEYLGHIDEQYNIHIHINS